VLDHPPQLRLWGLSPSRTQVTGAASLARTSSMIMVCGLIYLKSRTVPTSSIGCSRSNNAIEWWAIAAPDAAMQAAHASMTKPGHCTVRRPGIPAPLDGAPDSDPNSGRAERTGVRSTTFRSMAFLSGALLNKTIFAIVRAATTLVQPFPWIMRNPRAPRRGRWRPKGDTTPAAHKLQQRFEPENSDQE
jgi:hypothetical protein